MKKTPRPASTRRSSRGPIFVDLYLEETLDEGKSPLKLIARFRGRRSAQRALEQPEFLLDLARSGGTLYMSTVGGKTPAIANALPSDVDTDEDERCWWKGYTRVTDGNPYILWSLIWPKPDVIDELLDLIIRV